MAINTSITDPGIDLETLNIEEEVKKFSNVKVVGSHLLVRRYIPQEIHVNNKGIKTSIILPESTREEYKHIGRVGLVVALGKDAYNERFKNGPYCWIGDWVLFPKYEGISIDINGICCYLVEDASIAMVLDSPLICGGK